MTFLLTLTLAVLGLTFCSWGFAFAMEAAWFLLVSLLFTSTRFEFKSKPIAWLKAFGLSIPHTSTYLLGRLVGIFWVIGK
jgi:hypothetical protein